MKKLLVFLIVTIAGLSGSYYYLWQIEAEKMKQDVVKGIMGIEALTAKGLGFGLQYEAIEVTGFPMQIAVKIKNPAYHFDMGMLDASLSEKMGEPKAFGNGQYKVETTIKGDVIIAKHSLKDSYSITIPSTSAYKEIYENQSFDYETSGDPSVITVDFNHYSFLPSYNPQGIGKKIAKQPDLFQRLSLVFGQAIAKNTSSKETLMSYNGGNLTINYDDLSNDQGEISVDLAINNLLFGKAYLDQIKRSGVYNIYKKAGFDMQNWIDRGAMSFDMNMVYNGTLRNFPKHMQDYKAAFDMNIDWKDELMETDMTMMLKAAANSNSMIPKATLKITGNTSITEPERYQEMLRNTYRSYAIMLKEELGGNLANIPFLNMLIHVMQNNPNLLVANSDKSTINIDLALDAVKHQPKVTVNAFKITVDDVHSNITGEIMYTGQIPSGELKFEFINFNKMYQSSYDFIMNLQKYLVDNGQWEFAHQITPALMQAVRATIYRFSNYVEMDGSKIRHSNKDVAITYKSDGQNITIGTMNVMEAMQFVQTYLLPHFQPFMNSSSKGRRGGNNEKKRRTIR